MAVMQRVDIIAEAKIRAGRKAQNLILVNAYDAIVELMSTKYPLIPHQRATGSMVSGQMWIDPPVNVRSVEKLQVGATLSDIDFFEPEIFNTFKGATSASPTKWSWQLDPGLTPAGVYAVAWAATTARSVNDVNFPLAKFTGFFYICTASSGSTAGTEPDWPTNPGDTVVDGAVTWTCRKLKYVTVYPVPNSTYAYALYYSKFNGKSTGDSYQHLMTEYMDETVIRGVTWKALELIREFQKAVDMRTLFFDDLQQRATVLAKRFRRVEYPDL